MVSFRRGCRMTPRPQIKRLPERKHVTIIAGFKSEDGIIICGDTQETQGDNKRNVNKIRVEPQHAEMLKIMAGVDLAVAFGGAGHGPFVDMIIDKSWHAASSTKSITEAASAIESEIKRIYKEYGGIYQRGQCPYAEILYGIKADGESRLFMASGPIIVEKEEYETSGTGSPLANYLASKMYGARLTLYQCLILATYVLLQTKGHVEGCGGESHIAVLRNDGRCGLVDKRRVEAITSLLDSADTCAGRLLLRSADLTASESDLEKYTKEFTSNVSISRSIASESIRNWDKFWETMMGDLFEDTYSKDPFGFIAAEGTPSK